jgi:glycosyltransferase involved in cell wall biosynthesis
VHAVSVIVPAWNAAAYIWNAAAYITAAVESALTQTLPAGELILVNDGSPDTRELEHVLTPYLSRQNITYITQENGGPGAARNAGIVAAGGDYLAFLDADDWWRPTTSPCRCSSSHGIPRWISCTATRVWWGTRRLRAGRSWTCIR